MKTSSKITAIFLAVFATMAQTVNAATAAQLKTTIDDYGLSAAASGNTVTVTGIKTNVTEGLSLDIDADVTVIWKATLSGNVDNSCGLIGCEGGPVVVPLSSSPPALIYITGSGTFEMQSGSISNTATTAVIMLNSDGTVKISGGTVAGNGMNNAIMNASLIGFIRLSGAPTITGLIATSRVIVDAGFAPGETIYGIFSPGGFTQCMVLVEGGGGFLQNFQFRSTGWIPEVRGNDLIARKSSEACPDEPPSSSRENPQIGQIAVQAKAMHIVLENLPSNSKIEIFNLQGKRIYSNHSENSQILKIPVQTKGMYIVKINNSNALKIPVM
jgi:hypothetical protein